MTRSRRWYCLLAWLAGCAPSAPAQHAEAGTAARETPAKEAAAPVGPGAGSAPAASSATENTPAPPAATPSPNAAGEIELDSGDDLDADIAALSKATASGAERKPESKPAAFAGRDIVYRVTQQGLVIEVGGIHLRPEAKAVKEAGGTYAVQLTLGAESFDERQYWLAKPAGGPLAIAGKIEGAAGKKQRFSDQKRGEAEQEVVRAGEPRKFKQRWPGKGQPKLRSGQTLTLEVGLWGVHADTEQERAVKRLFELKLVAADPPQAVISAPTPDWGS
jgi:hypothetical protein